MLDIFGWCIEKLYYFVPFLRPINPFYDWVLMEKVRLELEDELRRAEDADSSETDNSP